MKPRSPSHHTAPVENQPVPLFRHSIASAEISAARRVLRSPNHTTGPEVGLFEAELSSFFGTSNVLATASCTAALHLAMLAIGVGPGDEVITTPITFPATVNAILLCGATPVFADVNLATLNMEPQAVEEQVTPQTRAILPVHMGGYPVAMTDILAIGSRYQIPVIVDAAHAVASYLDGGHIAAYGDLVCFSFYATKNLSTVEGGALTGRADLVARARLLSRHGIEFEWDPLTPGVARRFTPVAVGLKYNMNDVQAAIGRVQLSRLAALQRRRLAVAHLYDSRFRDEPAISPIGPTTATITSSWYLYQVLLPEHTDIAAVQTSMRRDGISTGRFYSPLHLHDLYAMSCRWSSLTHAENAYRRLLALPIHPAMTMAAANRVADALLRALAGR